MFWQAFCNQNFPINITESILREMQLLSHDPSVQFCNLRLLLHHQWLFQRNFSPNAMFYKKLIKSLKYIFKYFAEVYKILQENYKIFKLLFFHIKWTKTNIDDLFAMSILSSSYSENMSLINGFISKVSSIFVYISVILLWIVLFVRKTELTNLAADSLTFFSTGQFQPEKLVFWLWYEPCETFQLIDFIWR